MTPDTIIWTPVMHQDELFFHCSLEFIGLQAQGVSRHKHTALAYALRELAILVEGKPTVCPR